MSKTRNTNPYWVRVESNPDRVAVHNHGPRREFHRLEQPESHTYMVWRWKETCGRHENCNGYFGRCEPRMERLLVEETHTVYFEQVDREWDGVCDLDLPHHSRHARGCRYMPPAGAERRRGGIRRDFRRLYWGQVRAAERTTLRELARQSRGGSVNEDTWLPGGNPRHATFSGGYWD